MKQLKLLYALLFAVAIIACKDDDETPTFKKEAFVGVWNVTKFEGANGAGNDDGPCRYEFTATEMDEVYCEGGTEISLFSGAYTFDNKNVIKYNDEDFGKYTLTISSLNTTTIVLVLKLDGTKVGTVTATKK